VIIIKFQVVALLFFDSVIYSRTMYKLLLASALQQVMQNTNLPINIDSKLIWNDTGINLVAGQEYHFQATGQWTDWTITSNADGYESTNFFLKLCERLRRMPNSPWFSLIGSIDKDQDSGT